MTLRTIFICCGVFLALVDGVPSQAQQPKPLQPCDMKIEEPKPGARVGTSLIVRGTVTGIASGQYLWILVNPEGLQAWWPQGNGPARIRDGAWSVRSYVGEPKKNIGEEFFIQAMIVNADTNGRLQKASGGRLDAMPDVIDGCLVLEIKVMKTSD